MSLLSQSAENSVPWLCPQQRAVVVRAVVVRAVANITTMHTHTSQSLFFLHQPVLFLLIACTYVFPLHDHQTCICSLANPFWDLLTVGQCRWLLCCTARLVSRVLPGQPLSPCLYLPVVLCKDESRTGRKGHFQ